MEGTLAILFRFLFFYLKKNRNFAANFNIWQKV